MFNQIEFPRQAAVGTIITKTALNAHIGANARLRRLLTSEVAKLVWAYKLSPEVVNIKAGKISEIQVFDVALKKLGMSEALLRSIDQAIPSPIIFRLRCPGKSQLVAAHKRASGVNKSKQVLGDHYYRGEWIDDGCERAPMPVASSIDSLYEALLSPLLGLEQRAGESFAGLLARAKDYRIKSRELKALVNKKTHERQYKIRFQIHQEIVALKKDIAALMSK